MAASIQITIPREIIKWMQSLDLSYSVRDVRRDLMNGFIIAEIFSRYYPGKIYMHSLDNSSNQLRKQSNWSILLLFFQKNELPFKKNDFDKILQDNDFEQLVDFISKIYTFLTQKKISKPPLATYLQTNKDFYSTVSQTDKGNMNALGTSFILKDKGLERLEDKKNLTQGGAVGDTTIEKDKDNTKLVNESVVSEKPGQINNTSSAKKTNFLRNFNKPISQNQESGNLTIDVKNISIRQVNLNFSRLKEQPSELKMLTSNIQNQMNNKSQLMNKEQKKSIIENRSALIGHEDMLRAGTNTESLKSAMTTQKKDKQAEKTIFDALNEIISLRFSIPTFSEELKKIKVKNSTILQAYCDNVDAFSDDFSSSFFEELLGQTDSLVKFVFKDQNELWKYLNFLFTCLKGFTNEGKGFKTLVEAIKLFGEKCLEYNPQNAYRTRQMFQQYYLTSLAFQITNSSKFERKEFLLKILYSFCPQDPKSRFEMILSYKSFLKSPIIYLQSLVILVSYETHVTDENKQIIDEMIKNARTHIFSNSSNLRTMALALFNKLLDIDFNLMLPLIEKSIVELANGDWWEAKAFAIMIFSKSIKGIIESEKYQSLLKQNTSTHKSFSLENEQMIARFNEKIGNFAKGIQIASLPPCNEHIVRITFISISSILGEHKSLMELFIHLFLLSAEDTRKWVFYSNNTEEDLNKEEFLIESDRSLRYKINIKSQDFLKFASNILIYIVEMIKEMKLDRLSAEYMDLLVFGFTYTDFKMINMELCENINNSVKEYVFISLCDDEMCQRGKTVVSCMLKLLFYSEVKIKDSEKIFGSAICLIYQNKFEHCIRTVEELLSAEIQEAFDNASDIMKRYFQDVYIAIRNKSGDIYLHNTSLSQVFQPIAELMDIEDAKVKKVGHESLDIDIEKNEEKVEVSKNEELLNEEEVVGDKNEEEDLEEDEEEA